MDRISGKPLKTRDSGTLGVAGILICFLGYARAVWSGGYGYSGLFPLKRKDLKRGG